VPALDVEVDDERLAGGLDPVGAERRRVPLRRLTANPQRRFTFGLADGSMLSPE
jgi:hypothetical protein